MSVDFPAPGTPEMPTRMALPVRGKSACRSAWAWLWSSARRLSTRVIARARVARSPADTPAISASRLGRGMAQPSRAATMRSSTRQAASEMRVPGPKISTAPAACSAS
jgi:hypothetical protein